MEVLIQNFSYITWQMLVMWAIGGALIDRNPFTQCRDKLSRHS